VATDSTAYVVPSQTGQSGKFLKTDGTTSSWETALASIGTAGTYTTPASITTDSFGRVTSVTSGTGVSGFTLLRQVADETGITFGVGMGSL